MALVPGLFLYHLTLAPPTAIHAAIVGSFSAPRQHEIVVARGSRLELLRPDSTTGRVHSIVIEDTFSVIRSLAPFRLTGSNQDNIIVGSDSGRIAILSFNATTTTFTRVHLETFGRSGSRRIIPGQYLATDPKGRAVMIGAIDKAKLVYILNRDAAANLTISSPLEAHRSNTLTLHMVGVDVGYENPIFAALELDYADADQDPTGEAARATEKVLTLYELDLGLNHVVRKWSQAVERSANLLVQVPGGQDGPSGVLVCSKGWISYRHPESNLLRVPVPRRKGPLDDATNDILIASAVTHKMRGGFFFLVQTEQGDVFKLTLEWEGTGQVQSLQIKYFDTVPLGNALCILKSGFLFVPSEAGNHQFYHFEKLGDDDEEHIFSSDDYVTDKNVSSAYFEPRALDNLSLVDTVASLAPLTFGKVLNLTNEDTPQIYTMSGQRARGTMRTLRHGLEVDEIVASELPGVPNAVWTTKLRRGDEHDSYIVLSFVNGTLILSIGETVEEVTGTGFLATGPTLAVQQIGEDAIIQVHPHGLRHILADKEFNEWKAPGHRSIVAVTTNSRQVVLALSSGELVYFEMDNLGLLQEYQERKSMDATITCLSIAEVPEGRTRTKFLAVGCDDNTIRMISLDPETCLDNLSIQALTAPASSLCMVELMDASVDQYRPSLFCSIGLSNGVMLRTYVDTISGQLTDTRTRFLGSRPVQLFKVVADSQTAVLALSSRSWLNYTFQGQLKLSPLIYDQLDYASSFSSERCPQGIVAITGNNLRIFSVDRLGSTLKQDAISLHFTPRRMVQHSSQPFIYTIETDHNAWAPSEKAKRLQNTVNGDAALGQLTESEPEQFGSPRRGKGHWASCIKVLSPLQSEILASVDLENNEAAFSMALVPFASRENEEFLIVGTGQNVIISPRESKKGYLHTYRLTDGGRGIELVHKTECEDVPMSMTALQGRLLVGMGNALRIYDMGLKKLLRKCESRDFPTAIVALEVMGNRVYVGDMQDSIFLAVYNATQNRILVFADDILPRFVSAFATVDYSTVAIGDRFGTVTVNRLDQEVSDRVDEDVTGVGIMHERGYLQGAAHRIDLQCAFFTGDLPTSIQKVPMVAGGRDILVYTGLMGTIGVLIPFQSREDVELMTTIEMHMREHAPSLTGRDHLAYRSHYIPVKGVIDGDLCEKFNQLTAERQRTIANELDRTVGEIQKKMDNLRNANAF